jgi:hypothetical protein
VCFNCFSQELLDKGETLNPVDVEKWFQRDDGEWRSKNVTVQTGGGTVAGTSLYHYTDLTSDILRTFWARARVR